jgi:hypothetical protein
MLSWRVFTAMHVEGTYAMPKKTIAILAALSMGVGLPGAYLQAIVSWDCDNYCFAPGYPTPPLLSLWFPLFLLGSLLGVFAWIVLLEKQFRQRKRVWMGFTLISGLLSGFGFLGALLGAPEATFLLLVCAMYVLIALLVIPEATPSQEAVSRRFDPNLS